MEHESFEDEEIAEFINRNYVAIKVDREERPELDAIYMRAVVSLVGRGGWPLTVWLTAEAEPFYGGTYFPRATGTGVSAPGSFPCWRTWIGSTGRSRTTSHGARAR